MKTNPRLDLASQVTGQVKPGDFVPSLDDWENGYPKNQNQNRIRICMSIIPGLRCSRDLRPISLASKVRVFPDSVGGAVSMEHHRVFLYGNIRLW
jgi:hypothetical protein